MDKKTLLRKRLTSYSATAAAMTALATHATGQTYSGEKNIVVDNTTVNIDLDNDGTNDFSFENKHFSIYDYNQLRSLDATNNQWIGPSTVSSFGANTNFPYYAPNSTYSNDWITNLGNTYFGVGNFAGQGDKYIAVKFSASRKLGWIRINIPTGHATMTIRDWACTEGGVSFFVTGSLKPFTSDSSISDVTATTAKLNLTSNAEGTVYYAVQSTAVATIPTATEIKAGAGFIASGNGAATANVALSLDMTGLSEHTAYKVFFIVENPMVSGNISEVVELPFTTADVTAPVLSVVSVNGLSGNGATAHLTSDENGTAYFAVLTASAAAPSSTEIKTETGFVFAGNTAATASVPVEMGLTGLSSETDYKVYMVVEDASGNISEISSASFTTLDVTSPVLSGVTVDGLSGNGATAHLTSGENGTAYFAVLAASATAPSSSGIKTGTGFVFAGNTAATASVPVELGLTGLSSETDYKVYMVVEDASGNISEISSASFTTLDDTSPVLSGVTVDGNTVTGATAHLTSDEAGTAYYAVLAASATAPIAAEIITGTGFTASGNVAVIAGTGANLNITGLSANTAYSFYAIVVDASDNTSAISKVDFSTIISSVNEVTDDATVNLFPNPAHGFVQISIKGSALYKIINITGTVVKSGKLEEGRSTLDISNLPEGNYYILITIDGTTFTKKLIVS